MKNLVRRLAIPVICDTYTCNNQADFEVGHEVVKASNVQLCSECLRTIIAEGSELLGINATPTENITVETESGTETNVILDAENEKPAKVYTCRYCKRDYTDLKEYRSHISKCSRIKKEDK